MKRKKQDRQMRKIEQQQRQHITNVIGETNHFVRHLYYIQVDKFLDELGLNENDKISAYRLCLVFGFTFVNKEQKFVTDVQDSPNNPMLAELKKLIPSDKLVFDLDNIEE